MRCYIKAFKNYCKSEGRATRKELWLFFLFHYLIIFVLSFLDGLFGFYSTTIPLDYGYMTLAYLLISICPAACVQIRRLHDVNKSGTWWLLFNVPLVSFYVLYLYLKRGDDGFNSYGPPPGRNFYGESEPVSSVYEPLVAPVPFQPQVIEHQELPSTPPQIKFCRKCGNKLIEGSEFCSNCGTKVIDANVR